MLSKLTDKCSGQHLVSEVSETTEDDAVLICFTSGTTGVPKGAVLNKEAIKTNALNSLHMHALSDQDTILLTLQHNTANSVQAYLFIARQKHIGLVTLYQMLITQTISE